MDNTTLPFAPVEPSAIIHAENLSVIGLDAKGYTCSLQAILSCNQLIAPPGYNTLSWVPLPRLPVIQTTVSSIQNQLVAVGGRQYYSTEMDVVFQLKGRSWVPICSLLKGRQMCLVQVVSSDKILIVGGIQLCEVEECSIIVEE